MTNSDEWQAIWGAVGSAISLVGLGFAGYQLRRSAVAEESASRPYVNVRFGLQATAAGNPTEGTGGGIIFVYVESVGATPATEVSLTVRPPFQSSGVGRPSPGDASDPAMIALRHIFDGERRVSMLAPGERLQYVLDHAREVINDRRDLPTRYEVTASYGVNGSKKRYKGEFVLDIDPWRYSIMQAEPIDVIARQMRRLNQNLEGRSN